MHSRTGMPQGLEASNELALNYHFSTRKNIGKLERGEHPKFRREMLRIGGVGRNKIRSLIKRHHSAELPGKLGMLTLDQKLYLSPSHLLNLSFIIFDLIICYNLFHLLLFSLH